MVAKIIENMNDALKNNLYFAALSLVLILPDICGKAEYPDKHIGNRYRDWFKTYVEPNDKSFKDQECTSEFPCLTGEIVYSLRNFFIHQGTPNIDVNKIDYFELIIESKKEFNVYAGSSSISNDKRKLSINIHYLCSIIGNAALQYYMKNKDKFNFIKYQILDLDKIMIKITE